MSFLVGLTGPSGAGKSTACRAFSDGGAEVLDCDRMAAEVTRDKSECSAELKRLFPDCYDGFHLNRQKMADLIFSDKKLLKIQNEVVFKYLTAELDRRLAGFDGIAVLDAPTLFQSGLDKRCKKTVCVLCDEQTRVKRIAARDNILKSQIKLRFSSQLADGFFTENCDYVIYNNESKAELYEKARAVFSELKEAFDACEEKN